MSRPPSTPPPPETLQPPEPAGASVTIAGGLGLSNAQAKQLINSMRGMIREVGCPVYLHADALQDAFVAALCKPISERPSVLDWKRFVAWMCTLAKYSALTHRNAERRRREDHEVSNDELAQMLSMPAQVPDPGLRDGLQQALASLDPEQQALLLTHYYAEKSVQEIADEKNLAWTTVKSRLDRALFLLRTALQTLLVAALLLVTKNARAQGARLARYVSHLLSHATPAAWAMSVTVVCGVMVPANSTALGVVHPDAPLPPVMAAAEATDPSFSAAKVASVKPIILDEPEMPWFSRDMKSTRFAMCLQTTAVPFAFLAASALTNFGCAGGERQTPPPEEPEEEYEHQDPYDAACENYRHRGEDCPSKAEWCALIGKRPARKGCQ